MSSFMSVAARYGNYLKTSLETAIFDGDEMLARQHPDAMDHYLLVGRSAIDLIARAMVAADKPVIATVLDLPCGAGRVTRHLKAFLPDADIYAGDLEKPCEDFVIATFKVKRAEAPADFRARPDRSYDLIFVGSLVTHFDADMFERAVKWFIDALAPDGLLVLTTHGRRAEYWEREHLRMIDPEKWSSVVRARFAAEGFGYIDYDPEKPGYGLSACSPSWLLRLVESEPRTRIVGFQEAGWAAHQDVLVLHKRAIY